MITLTANTRRAKATTDDAITTGSVGIPVTLSLSDDFDGLSSTVRFKSGTDTADVPVLGEQITVPPQCLQTANAHLYVGVYALDGNGNVVIPTVWADAGIVRRGVTPYDADPTDPTPGWGAQVQQWAMDAHDTAERLAAEVDGWETGENARIAAESARASAERSRVNAEAVRVSNESARISAESSRATAETARSYAEAARVTVEQARASAETSRNSAETDRGRNESARISAESARATAESSRVTAERQRVLAEQSRVSAESARATAEQNRANAESARATAEQARSSAESARASAETSRANEWTALKADAVSATSAANTAASSANTAASDIRAAATRGDFDGYSPTVSISSTDSAHTVTITDKAGDHSYTVPTYAEEEAARAYAWGELSAEATEAIGAAQEAAAEVAPQVAQLFGNQLTGTLSGTIDTASDAYAAPPMALSVEGASTQAGTPTPDAPVPIMSVDDLSLVCVGKNLLNPATCEQGKYLRYSGVISSDASWYLSDYIGVLPNVTYTLDANTNTYTIAYHMFYDANKNVLANVGVQALAINNTFTTPSGAAFVRLSIDHNPATSTQFIQGSTATAYEPYQGQTVPDLPPDGTSLRSLPDGTKDELQLAYLRPSTRAGWAWYSRELVQAVGHKVVTAFDRIGVAAQGSFHSRRGIVDIDEAAVNNTNAGICSHAPWSKSNSAYSGYLSVITAFVAYSNNKVLSVSLTLDENDENFTTLENMNEWVAENGPIVFDYKLVTPVTTVLDPIELPQLPAPNATVWCDGGSATPSFVMEYVRDTNLVVQQLTAETAIAYASIAAQDGPTATASHAIGTYLTMGGTLYKVTSAIAVGETIAAGTNVTATTVMAELLAKTA